MSDLKFSIIICCYNSKSHIKQTILSIINQDYKNFEIILVDDGSSDDTLEIIREFEKKYNNIKVFSNDNMGLGYSRNYAIDKAQFDWIVFLDHDDISLPNRLSVNCDIIKENKNINLIFSDAIYFNNSQSYSRFDKSYNYLKVYPYELDLSKNNGYLNLLKYGCFIASSSVTINKKTYLQTSGFNNNYKFLTDYVFFLEISKISDIYCYKYPLVKWRMHSSQSSEKNTDTYYLEMCKLYLNLYFDKSINFSLKLSLLSRNMVFFLKYLFKKINYFE